MINVSKAFRRMLYNNQRNYLAYADITLESGTELNLTEQDLLAGGFSREDSVSGDESFSALGSAAIGSATIIINDMDESYVDYDFTNAKVVLYTGLEIPENGSTRTEDIKLGTYTVDKATYAGNAITLTLLDNMEQFDRPYSGSNLVYPATLYEIVSDACTKCNVILQTNDFPHKTYEIQTRPEDEAITFRDVISWVAAIAGCFARCNADGKLELKWFNQSALESRTEGYDGGRFDGATPYATGDSLDGGSFNPWNTGSEADGGNFTDSIPIHYIYGLFSQNISVDDVIITGVRILVRNDDVESATGTTEYSAGLDGYVIEISNNELITSDNASEIVTWLGTQLIGLRFRKASVTHSSDPTIEAGDVGILWDRKGREYPILITRATFSIGSSQTIVCGAETPSRNSATLYSSATKAYVESRKMLKKERTAWQAAQENLEERIENADGLYHTDETDTGSGAVIHYLHNKPDKEDSDILIMVSDVGITMTANALDQTPTWYGLTVDGNLLASVINTMSLFFDYAHGGTLTLGGDNNVNGTLRILNASGTQVGSWTKDGTTTKSLTADDYIYVNGNANSHFELPLCRSVASTDDNYIRISDGGFKIRASAQYHVGGTSGIKDTLIEFGTDQAAYNTGNNKPAVKLSNGNDVIEMTLCRFILNDSGSNTIFTINSQNANHGGKGFAIYRNGDKTDINTLNSKISGSLTVSGTKSRIVNTEDYGNRLLYCYETPTPMFGDTGEGVIGEDGLCYVTIDPTFAETISSETTYQVFLQNYGEGTAFVKERKSSYFVVQGTPGMKFGWELKAKQRDYEMLRLDRKVEEANTDTEDYGGLALSHITEVMNERGHAA